MDGFSGHLTYLEIQEGKNRMKQKEFFKDLGATSSCVARASKFCSNIEGIQIEEDKSDEDEDELLEHSSDEEEEIDQEIWLGDSWFGSVKTVTHLARNNKYAIMNIKTAQRRCPKAFLEQQMQDMPGGTWIVLEGRAVKEGVDLVSIRYKYNKKCVSLSLQ